MQSTVAKTYHNQQISFFKQDVIHQSKEQSRIELKIEVKIFGDLMTENQNNEDWISHK